MVARTATHTSIQSRQDIDAGQVHRALAALIAPGQVVEVRALEAITRDYNRPHTVSGYFNDVNTLVSALKFIIRAKGIYFTINPCERNLLARANNRLRSDKSISTTTDAQIIARRWLFLDLDPVRSGGIADIPASNAEHEAALKRAQAIRETLSAEGWPRPIEIDSGNGAALLYAIDLPAQDNELVKHVLEGLAKRFNDDLVELDTSVFNPARIIRLCGTWNCKGDSFEDRQYRMATLLNVPTERHIVTRELLEAVVIPVSEPERVQKHSSGSQLLSGASRAWALKALQGECAIMRATTNKRNVQLNKSAFALGQIVGGGNLSRDEVERELYDAAFCTGLPDNEIKKAMKSGIEDGMAQPRSAPEKERPARPQSHPLAESNGTSAGAGAGNNHSDGAKPTDQWLCNFDADDSGNGDAMFALYGQEFLWCYSRGWFAYNGTHWQLDADGAQVKRRVVETLRRRRHAAVDADKDAIIKCTKADESRVNGCIGRFKTLVSVSIDEFDSNPDLLNCQNGVVDLRTGMISPHDRKQRFTYCLPVAYEQANYFEWVEFLESVIGGGKEVIDYIQEAVGYSLTGHTREEILFYLFGPPRAGKGTFAETIMALLPTPLSTMVDFNSFTAKREGDVSNFDLAPLKPARLIFASESNRNQSLNPAKIKQLTGGDYITCSFKHRDFFSYRPQFKVWMMSNHPVNGDPEDDALWGRVRVIEFPNSFLGMEDKGKKARLKEPDALQGVLAWAVQGAIKWYAHGAQGLITPQSVAATTQAQRKELDYVQQWLDECCEDNESGWVANEEVMASYTAWCKGNNVPSHSIKSPVALSLSLKQKGYQTGKQKKIGGKNRKGVEGLYIYPEPIDSEEEGNGNDGNA